MALFILAFGVVFELPVVLVLLAKVGVIDDKFLRKNRRWAVAHHGRSPRPSSRPARTPSACWPCSSRSYVLYEISIVIARFVQPKREDDAGR